MTTLILLNGPPGVGKSTLAQRYVDDHPLALNLDIDRIRSLLGRWQEDAMRAGLAARAIALSAARTHLHAGHDVVVPQLLARPEFIVELEGLAGDLAVGFAEIVLLAPQEEIRQRFAERTRLAADPEHTEAATMLERSGGAAQLDRYHADLLALVESRPSARVVTSTEGAVEQTYADVLAAVDAAMDAAGNAAGPAGSTARPVPDPPTASPGGYNRETGG